MLLQDNFLQQVQYFRKEPDNLLNSGMLKHLIRVKTEDSKALENALIYHLQQCLEKVLMYLIKLLMTGRKGCFFKLLRI